MPLTLPPDLLVLYFSDTALSPFRAVESITSIRAGASDATGSVTKQRIAVMHSSAKVEADPIMPAWSTCRSLPTNATPDQMPDIESCSEGYEVKYCRIMTRANLTIVASLRFRLKEICVRICICGEASVHLLSF